MFMLWIWHESLEARMLKMNGGRIGRSVTELLALLAEDNFPFDIPELQVQCCSAKSIILIRAQFAKTS